MLHLEDRARVRLAGGRFGTGGLVRTSPVTALNQDLRRFPSLILRRFRRFGRSL